MTRLTYRHCASSGEQPRRKTPPTRLPLTVDAARIPHELLTCRLLIYIPQVCDEAHSMSHHIGSIRLPAVRRGSQIRRVSLDEDELRGHMGQAIAQIAIRRVGEGARE